MALLAVLKQQSIFDSFSNATILYSLLLSLFSFLSILYVLKLTRNKPNLPPSPPKLPIIGNLHQLGTLPHRSFGALSQKYGPLMLLQLGQIPTLVVSSVGLASEIFKTHDVVFANRPGGTSAEIFLYGRKDVGFAPYGEDWRQKRKICVLELLSVRRVRSFQFIREEEIAHMVNKIHEACKNGRRGLNLSAMLMATSNNIVSRCVIGQKHETHDGGDSKFGELARKTMIDFVSFSVGDFFPSLGWIDNVSGLIRKLKATFVSLDAFYDTVVAEHKTIKRNDDVHTDGKDFVDVLLQLQESGMLDFELTPDDLKAILMDMFVGGSDTTSTTLEWAFAELVNNPTAMKKVQEEVRRVVGSKPKIDENDIQKMNYLKCVVKETLRLHPPVPFLVPRETTSGVKLGGFYVPQRTRVFINVWAIQRDPNIWERPEEFIPERFEHNRIDFKGQDFQFIPFGAGRRGCPGIAFAVASIEYILANLLYWFNWKLPEIGSNVGDFDLSETYGLTVVKKVPLHVEPIPYSFGSMP